MRKATAKTLLLLALCSATLINAAESITVTSNDKGAATLKTPFGDLSLSPILRDAKYRNYKFTGKNDAGQAVYKAPAGDATVAVTASLTKSSGRIIVDYSFDISDRKALKTGYLRLRLPCSSWQGGKVQIGNKKYDLTKEKFKEQYWGSKSASLYHPKKPGIIEIKSKMMIPYGLCDLRYWKDPVYVLRIRLPKEQNKLRFSMEFLADKTSSLKKVIPTQSGDWQAFALDLKDSQKTVWSFDSAFHTPAGKYGFVQTKGPHFVIGNPPKRIRFWGVNISGPACYPSHEQAEKIALFLRNWGVNAVRLSHLDAEWAKGIIDYGNKTEMALKEDRLDLFFYLLGQLKKNGIYYVIDGKHDMSFKTKDFKGLDGFWNRSGSDFLITFSTKARQHFKTYLRELFSRKNPYTDLALAEDPALAAVQMVNETFLNMYPSKIKTLDDVPAMAHSDFQAKWQEWSSTNKITGSFNENNAPAIRKRFISWLERSSFQELYAFFRKDLNVKCPLSTTSCYVGTVSMPSAADGDYTEGHAYYSHPRPQTIVYDNKKCNVTLLRNTSSYVGNNIDVMLPFLLQQRIGYQPFVLGEWNNCMPECFDAPLLMATLGDIQDMDAMFLFNFSQNTWKNLESLKIDSFTSFGNPGIMINMIPAALAWHQALIPAAKNELAVTVSESELFDLTTDGKVDRKSKKNFGEAVDAQGKVVKRTEPYTYGAFAENAFLFKMFNIPNVPGIRKPGAETISIHHTQRTAEASPKQKKEAEQNSPLKITSDLYSINTKQMVSMWGVVSGNNNGVGPLKVDVSAKQEFSVTAIALDQQPLTQSKRILVTLGTVSCAKQTVLLEERNPQTNALTTRYIYKRAKSEPMYKLIDARISFQGKDLKCYRVSNNGVKSSVIAESKGNNISWQIGKQEPGLFFLLESSSRQAVVAPGKATGAIARK